MLVWYNWPLVHLEMCIVRLSSITLYEFVLVLCKGWHLEVSAYTVDYPLGPFNSNPRWILFVLLIAIAKYRRSLFIYVYCTTALLYQKASILKSPEFCFKKCVCVWKWLCVKLVSHLLLHLFQVHHLSLLGGQDLNKIVKGILKRLGQHSECYSE